ncbi:MAG TPA: hypothetical protein DEA99_07755 [Candidatus Omnitrophica bacterium]|nr:hypothetical protein [Candidatus Omnitrophota bacterium]
MECDFRMERGKAFELQVKELLEAELAQGRLGIFQDATKVYHRKSYYSSDRGSEIEIDVSIEVFRLNANEPFLVWAWECKDYHHSVPVGDIEEFHSKLEQIGLHKTKGTVVCRHEFQKGAVSFAEAKAIGLARIIPDGSIIRLREAAQTVTKSFIEFGLIEQDSEKLESIFYGLSSSGYGFIDFSEMISFELNAHCRQGRKD